MYPGLETLSYDFTMVDTVFCPFGSCVCVSTNPLPIRQESDWGRGARRRKAGSELAFKITAFTNYLACVYDDTAVSRTVCSAPSAVAKISWYAAIRACMEAAVNR